MPGIFYFSSTGNSLYLAKYIREKLGGDIFYIPQYAGTAEQYEKLIVVSPIYSWGLPWPTLNFLNGLKTQAPVYIVLNYGGMKGNADYFAQQTGKANGLKMQGVYSVKMPENYTLSFTQPGFYANSVLRKAPGKLDAIIEHIARDDQRQIPKPKKDHTTAKYLRNRANWHKIADDFSVGEQCVKCKKCIQICPVGNIRLKDGAISFGDRCIACLGCYHRCPQKAIIISIAGKKPDTSTPTLTRVKSGRICNPNCAEHRPAKHFALRDGALQ